MDERIEKQFQEGFSKFSSIAARIINLTEGINSESLRYKNSEEILYWKMM
jgi:hypothetical protein